MSKKGFEKPNYTQTPNQFFDEHMRDLNGSELKVTLAIIRKTFGFHKEKARISLTDLEEMTGLSRQSVIDGAAGAEEKGMISKVSDGGVNQWVVNFLDQDNDEGSQKIRLPVVKKLDQSSQKIRLPSTKETINKKEIKPLAAQEPEIKPIKPHKPDMVDMMLAYAKPKNNLLDLSTLPPHYQDYARAFVQAAGEEHAPKSFEKSKWLKILGQWDALGLSDTQIMRAVEKMRKDGLTIGGPESVTKTARDMSATPQKVDRYRDVY